MAMARQRPGRRSAPANPTRRRAATDEAIEVGTVDRGPRLMPDARDPRPLDAASVFGLQQTHGNAHVRRLIAPNDPAVARRADEDAAKAISSPPRPQVRRALSCSAESRRARRCVRPLSSRAAPAASSLGSACPPLRRRAATTPAVSSSSGANGSGSRKHSATSRSTGSASTRRWSAGGGEAASRNRFQKAFRVFVKVLETFDEVNSHWDKTHKAFAALIATRDAHVHNLGREVWPNLGEDERQKLLQSSRSSTRQSPRSRPRSTRSMPN